MRMFTVHLPGDAGSELPPAAVADRLVLVADGFSTFAFVLAPVWMLVNRLWLALAAYVVAMLVLELAFAAFGTHQLWQALIGLGVHLVIGLEADEIRRWNLARAGWRPVAVVAGRSEEDGEARFLERWRARSVTGAPSPAAAG